MRNFVLIAILGTTLSGCATIDEWLVRPFEIQEDGTLIEQGPSEAEELVDRYDDTISLVTPVQHKWIIPTVVAAIALASTIATRVRARKERKEEEGEDHAELDTEENKE